MMCSKTVITVRQAIPIVMGTNVGTSVTNTIVSMMQSADKEEFRRAFAAATVHDCFNWLTVLVLLPVETMTHFLETMTSQMVGTNSNVQLLNSPQKNATEFLNKLTKPFTMWILEVGNNFI